MVHVGPGMSVNWIGLSFHACVEESGSLLSTSIFFHTIVLLVIMNVLRSYKKDDEDCK